MCDVVSIYYNTICEKCFVTLISPSVCDIIKNKTMTNSWGLIGIYKCVVIIFMIFGEGTISRWFSLRYAARQISFDRNWTIFPRMKIYVYERIVIRRILLYTRAEVPGMQILRVERAHAVSTDDRKSLTSFIRRGPSVYAVCLLYGRNVGRYI